MPCLWEPDVPQVELKSAASIIITVLIGHHESSPPAGLVLQSRCHSRLAARLLLLLLLLLQMLRSKSINSVLQLLQFERPVRELVAGVHVDQRQQVGLHDDRRP